MGMLDGLNLPKMPAMPSFAGLGGGLVNALIVIVIISCIAFFGYLWWDNRRYKYKIEIYENLGGTRYVKTGSDIARLVKMGTQGEETLFLKKRKKIIGAYGRKMGPNLYWFAVGQDGIWYNVTLGDLDSKQGMLDIEPVDRDMRYAHVAIRKNLQDRYNKPKFMDKYGNLIMGAVIILICVIFVGYLVNKLSEISSVFASSAHDFAELAKANQQVVSALDNICSSSGITSG